MQRLWGRVRSRKGRSSLRLCQGPGWVTEEEHGQTLVPHILQTAAWGTLGTLRTFLSYNVDKDVQRLLKAIAGQGEPFPSALGHLSFRNQSVDQGARRRN